MWRLNGVVRQREGYRLVGWCRGLVLRDEYLGKDSEGRCEREFEGWSQSKKGEEGKMMEAMILVVAC